MDNKNQYKKLYLEIFEDSEKYVDYLFEKVYSENNLKYIESGGKVISALAILPRIFSYAKKSVTGAFISGVVTAPSMRGKGVMKDLMKEVLLEYSRKQCAVIFLSPKNEAYYNSQGFCTILNAKTMEIAPNGDFFKTKTVENSQEYHFLKLENSLKFDVYNLRSTSFSDKLFSAQNIDQSLVKRVYDKDKYLGYFVDDKDGIFEYSLPIKYADKVQTKSSKWFVFGDGQSFTMARIVNPFLLFSDIACKEEFDLSFTVIDNFLDKQYGIRFISKNGLLNAEKCDKGSFSVTIEDLTTWAFGKKQIDGLFDISLILGDGKILFNDRYL